MTASASSSLLPPLQEQIEQCLSRQAPESAVPLLECALRLTDESPTLLFQYAQCLFDMKEYDTALFQAKRLLERLNRISVGVADGSPLTSSFSGVGFGSSGRQGQGDTTNSQPTQTVVAEVALEQKAIRLAMRCCAARGDNTEAVVFAETLLRCSPHDVGALCTLARCAHQAGNTAQASARYQEALQADPLCTTAFDALRLQYLVSRADLDQLVATLVFPPGCETVKEIYLTKLAIDGCHDGGQVLGEDGRASTALTADGSSGSPLSFSATMVHHSEPTDGVTAETKAVVPLSSLLLRQASDNYRGRDLHGALRQTTQLFDASPFDVDGTTLHLAVLSEQHDTAALYEVGHRLVAERPQHSLAFYAIGCYYFVQHQYEKAGRFFVRSTESEPTLPAAHIALGHCYAKLEEGETALGVYRHANHLFPGLHLTSLFLGIQYTRVQQYTIAMSCIDTANKTCPSNPQVLNEVGVLYFKTGQLQKAVTFFLQALSVLPRRETPGESLECLLFNLGTVFRRLRDYEKALMFYQEYCRHNPNSAPGQCALGFTYHLMGGSVNTKAAIHHYHVSLSIRSDVFCRDLLERALCEEYSHDVGGHGWGESTVLQQLSPSPANLTFSTIGRSGLGAARSESCPGAAFTSSGDPSPQPIGRSLF